MKTECIFLFKFSYIKNGYKINMHITNTTIAHTYIDLHICKFTYVYIQAYTHVLQKYKHIAYETTTTTYTHTYI